MPVLDVAGVEIAYQVTGQGPAVVLVNGTGQQASLWDAQIDALRDAGFTVVTFDHRGCGQSSSPHGPYSVDQLADDLEQLLDHLAFPSYDLVGYSLGGYVALMAAGTGRAEVASLVLLGSAGRVSAYGMVNFAVRFVRARMSRDVGLAGQLRADLGWAVSRQRSRRAAELTVPVLAVAFQQDRLHTPSQIARAAKRFPTARYAEVEGCGHDAPFADPTRVFSVVVDFLSSVRR